MSMETVKANELKALSAAKSLLGVDASGVMGLIAPFCCMVAKPVSNSVDLDEITDPGLYSISQMNPNSPVSGSTAGLMMFVFQHSPGYVQQLVFSMRTNPKGIYCRTKEGASASWGKWYGLQLALLGGG